MSIRPLPSFTRSGFETSRIILSYTRVHSLLRIALRFGAVVRCACGPGGVLNRVGFCCRRPPCSAESPGRAADAQQRGSSASERAAEMILCKQALEGAAALADSPAPPPQKFRFGCCPIAIPMARWSVPLAISCIDNNEFACSRCQSWCILSAPTTVHSVSANGGVHGHAFGRRQWQRIVPVPVAGRSRYTALRSIGSSRLRSGTSCSRPEIRCPWVASSGNAGGH